VVAGIDKVVDGEVLFSVKKSGASPNDLLELSNGVNEPQENNITDIKGVNTRRKFLRSGQHRRDGFFIILKFPQMLLSQFAIIGGDSHTIVCLTAALELIDQIANHGRMCLVGAKDD